MPKRICIELFLVAVFSCCQYSVIPFSWGTIQNVKSKLSHLHTTTTSLNLVTSPTTLISQSEDVLASLFGSIEARNNFFTQDLGKNVIHKRRSSSDLPSPLSQISMRDLYDTCDCIPLRKRGSFDYLNKTEMSFDGFTNYIATGGSAVVPIDKENGDCALMPFKNSVGNSLQAEVGINVYHSGPSAVALNRHYDSYDVLVIQIEGEKEWEVCIDNERWTNLTMIPGDLLYIPKGIYHAATTAERFDFTTHATIGLPDFQSY